MKKFYFIPLLFAVSFFCSQNVIAQTGWTVYNSSTSILPTTVFKAIVIDNSGNIWSGGSYTGMYEFNGSTWSHYSTFNSTLLHDDVNDLVVDNSGQVWVANYKGISVWNGTTFTNYDTLNAAFNGMTVYTLGKDNNGVIWLASRNGSFGYQGITTYNGSTWTNLAGYPTQLQGEEFTDFAFSSSNLAWLGNSNGMANYNSSFTFYPYATTGIWSSDCVAIDGTGTVWAGGFDGLIKYNGSTWTMYSNTTFFGFPSNTFFYDILVDGNILWIGTAKGLLKVDRATTNVIANYNASNSPLTDNCVVDIKKDAAGNLWLATAIGVVKMVPSLVGMNENKSTIAMKMYPNPASQFLSVSIAGNSHNANYSYQILDISGAEIGSGEISEGNNKIDVSAFATGVYFLKTFASDHSENSISKFVISH